MPTTCPPIHPGEILNEEFLSPLRITQYRLAKAIGVDPRRIHAIVHGERGITTARKRWTWTAARSARTSAR